jgi:hypothetical protein
MLKLMPKKTTYDSSKNAVHGRASGVYGFRWDGWAQHWVMPPEPADVPSLSASSAGFDVARAERAERARENITALQTEKADVEVGTRARTRRRRGGGGRCGVACARACGDAMVSPPRRRRGRRRR